MPLAPPFSDFPGHRRAPPARASLGPHTHRGSRREAHCSTSIDIRFCNRTTARSVSAPSISNANFAESKSSAPFASEASDPALSFPETVSGHMKGFRRQRLWSEGIWHELGGYWIQLEGYGLQSVQSTKPQSLGLLALGVPYFNRTPIQSQFRQRTRPQRAPPGKAARPVSLVALGWLLYLGVFAALLLRLVFGLASALRLWLTAQPVSGLPCAEPAAGLRFSPRVASPVNIGSDILFLPISSIGKRRNCASFSLTRARTYARAISTFNCSQGFMPPLSGLVRWDGGSNANSLN